MMRLVKEPDSNQENYLFYWNWNLTKRRKPFKRSTKFWDKLTELENWGVNGQTKIPVILF